jgi:cysteine desulfurase / selenocysteine lyase
MSGIHSIPEFIPDELDLSNVIASLEELQSAGLGFPETAVVGGLPFSSESQTLLDKFPKRVLNVPEDSFSDQIDFLGLFPEWQSGGGGPDKSRLTQCLSKIGTHEVFDVQRIREDFPILHQQVNGKPLVWFDNAATTQKPKAVIDAITNYYLHDNSNIHRAAHTLAARSTDAYEGARDTVKRFINASSTDEIIFVRGTTEGINLVTQTYGKRFIQPGDEIIVSTLDHHANIVPWQQLAKGKGAHLKAIPINDRGEVILEAYEQLITPRTKIVSFGHVNNTFGTISPVKKMVEIAKRHGVRVLVDGAQSIAHTPVDVQDLDVDFFVFSGHKIYAPNGIGVVYGKKELLDIIPTWQGGGNMIKDVTIEETLFNDPPAKFEAGTPSVADAVGLGAALDYVNSIGLDCISRYEHDLTEYARKQLGAIPGVRLLGNPRERISVVSFEIPGIPTQEIGKLLDREGIALRAGHHCAQPALRRLGVEASVRPSFAFYNTPDEIDHLSEAVKRIASQQTGIRPTI